MPQPDSTSPALDRSSDLPLANPEQDLLGVSKHAEALARLIVRLPTPFTIGVYGEWGAGKTTFVQFVWHYLKQVTPRETPPILVHFEAWRYTSADELWRALIFDIARAIYKPAIPPDSPAGGPAGSRSLRALLAADAMVFRSPVSPATKDDEFNELVARLDDTMYSIGKRSESARGLDQNEAIAAAVQASLAALGTVSPLVGMLRRFFGGTDTLDTTKLLQREKAEAARERIESKRQFQDELSKLMRALPQPAPRLCVFLDDLDRCMPDVVLDLLEAVKIFLYVPQIIFIVAADEELIGQGLRLRYRDLLEGDTDSRQHELLARKGREYFEKIIQLRINLPESTPEHTHQFIAAQYPEWMPATDIILASVGGNPRRVKQYCSWLAYRRMVDQAEQMEQ